MLEDCRVPVENVLGEIGKGHVVAFNVLNLGRLKLGTRNLGSAKNALNYAISYSRERHQFGRAIGSFGLIKRKLAEMAIRCYVGDALVWRTLGMIDDALDAVDHDQPMQVLKAIEQYAVECSIIKVWTSEALGYVVDETVQVYGGYGYSKDYPAERAYRDARITRLYEGTNEINRTIIASRLLKAAASGALPLREEVEKLLSGSTPTTQGYVQQIGVNAKRAALLALDAVTKTYGDKAAEEQEALALAAEIVMEAYAIESAWLRTQKLSAASESATAQLAGELTRIYACDAAERVALNARHLLATLTERVDVAALPAAFTQLVPPPPINTIAARRKVAETLSQAGRYLW
jgi:hypothetical protein